MKALIEEVFDEFFKMSPEEFREGLEKHKNGDVARSLLDINCFDYIESDKISFCYDQHEQLPLNQDSYNCQKRTQAGLIIKNWHYNTIPIEQEPPHEPSHGSEPSQLEMDEVDYSLEYLLIKSRVYRKKKAPHMTEMPSTFSDLPYNSSDDYDYECAA